MSWLISLCVLLCLTGGGLLLWLLRRLGAGRTSLPVTADWIDQISIDRYRPIMRLLDGEDARFLQSQPGFTPQMVQNLRVQRCRMFRDYLGLLDEDFRRVTMALRILLVQSRHDRPDLARVLVQRRVVFAIRMSAVRVRLLLYRWGCCRVDATSLIETFNRQRLELRALMPSPALPF